MKQEVMEKGTSWLKIFLDYAVTIVTKSHSYILTLNDKFEAHFSDKALHFIVIAIVGMAMMMVIYPIFKWLASKNKVGYVTWIYVFSLLVTITLLIEIGQRLTGTGTMDFKDIVAGLAGFIVASFAWFFLVWMFRLVFKPKKKK